MNKRIFSLLLTLWLACCAAASAYYDPTTQAFLSRDPIREAGGINLYAYCENDPIGHFDPIGLSDSLFERMFPALAGRDDLVQTARESGLYAAYGFAQVPGKVAAIPKVQGSIRMAGGALEIGTGVAYSTATWGIGGVAGGGLLALNGADNFYAGLQTYRSDAYQPAFLERGITSVAGNGIVGNGLYAASQLGMGFVPTVGTRLLSVSRTRSLTSLEPSSLAGMPLGYQGGPGAMWIGEDIMLTAGNSRNFAYRVLRADENPASGLFAKNPAAAYTPEGHVLNGSRPNWASQYISVTRDVDVARSWANRTGNKIVTIDLEMVNGKIFDLSTGVGRSKFLRGITAKNFAMASSELLIEGEIPAEAIRLFGQ